MPHCIIEYSSDIENAKEILDTVRIVNTEIENSGLFDKKTIKTRALPIDVYLVGGVEKSFIHITVKILEGRTDTQKKDLSERILKCVLSKYNIENISVEIVELHTQSYSKN
ncbi:5-carboxymethyl-2-hydroxymuconate isomerase [Tenacibaculum litopenaei]|uniref:5-carboxymethyl-2-hydroxymuconate Delta-isomerase n=1 Tax=Tenacibaculum litopenaei TaxID=396016 RepID=UPI0038957C2F